MSQLIALAGSPNAGKSVLFNTLTGLHQKVGNYPGVTVEQKVGFSKNPGDSDFVFVDLPGTYSLSPLSLDEAIAVEVLTGKRPIEGHQRPDAVIAVIDSTNLERSLGLVFELKTIGLPICVALNMMDLARKRGLKLDIAKLSSALGAPVVPLVATKGEGVTPLLQQVSKLIGNAEKLKPSSNSHPASIMKSQTTLSPEERFKKVDEILSTCVLEATRADQLTWKIDQIVLHRFYGPLILAAILLVMFQSIFTWASPLADAIEIAIAAFADVVRTSLPAGMLNELLTDGVINGVGGVLVFLPQIVILFLLINLLETSGYMMRAAFILDRAMQSCGLQGRSFVPLLSSFACAIPGIMATRSIRSERDRLVTIMVAPLMTCSARLPVYTLLIAAFVPATEVFGFLNLQALAMFGLFVSAVVAMFLVALVTKIAGGKSAYSPLILELPTYRAPHWRYILTSVYLRIVSFLQRAGTIILASSVAIWFLSSYPKPPESWSKPAIEYSYAGRLGHMLEPMFAPIGFDWRISTSLIPGMAAREVMVSSLATVFAVEASEDEELTTAKLTDRISTVWAPATGFSLLAWYVFAPQCLSTLATVRRETGQWKWTLVMTVYMFALAWIASWVTFNFFSLIM